MQSLSAADILGLWEQGAGLHTIDQALLVLSFAFPEHDYEYLATLALGCRDLLLLEVHRRIFGDRLEAYTECPECQEPLEFSLSCALLSGDLIPGEALTKNRHDSRQRFYLALPEQPRCGGGCGQ